MIPNDYCYCGAFSQCLCGCYSFEARKILMNRLLIWNSFAEFSVKRLTAIHYVNDEREKEKIRC